METEKQRKLEEEQRKLEEDRKRFTVSDEGIVVIPKGAKIGF